MEELQVNDMRPLLNAATPGCLVRRLACMNLAALRLPVGCSHVLGSDLSYDAHGRDSIIHILYTVVNTVLRPSARRGRHWIIQHSDTLVHKYTESIADTISERRVRACNGESYAILTGGSCIKAIMTKDECEVVVVKTASEE